MAYTKSKQLIDNIPEVTCPYCNDYNGKEKQYLSPKHLSKHKKRIADVRREFPNHVTMTELELQNKQRQGKKHAIETKIVKCYYDGDGTCPGGNFTVAKNLASYIVCEHCKKAGKENPDGRTKPEANIKRTKGLQKKYGDHVTNVRQIPGVIEKTAKTYEKQGRKIGFAGEDGDKSRATMLKETGYVNFMNRPDGPAILANSIKKKYGPKIVNVMQILEVSKKVADTLRGQLSKLKGKTYEDIHGAEKAQELIEDKRVSGVKSYLKKPTPSPQQLELYNLVKEVFPLAKSEYMLIGRINDHGKFGYALDIAIQEHMLCIEFDGYYHLNDKQAEHDQLRDSVIEEVGWKTVRFNNVPSREELIDKIKKVLN